MHFSRGKTSDLRIKPEIMGNGYNINAARAYLSYSSGLLKATVIEGTTTVTATTTDRNIIISKGSLQPQSDCMPQLL